ncbi:MAG TPA: M14 family metallopeptidase [Parasegetibacter sp.]
MRAPVLLMACFLISFFAQSQVSYRNHDQLSRKLKELASNHSNFAKVQSIGKSVGGKDIWLLTLGKADVKSKTAVLITAGIDGKHPAGTVIATALAENYLKLSSDTLSRLLETKTIYIIPAVSPDALEHYFSSLRYERSGNATPTDDDRNGRIKDDPYEDLDGNGMITKIRILDPTGKYIPDPKDPRLMIVANPARGETGSYQIYTEGWDNDNDGQFNEDASEGVNIDQNFTFNYGNFEKGAGDYQASEPETKALLEFLYRNPNIHTVLNFGPAFNLGAQPARPQGGNVGQGQGSGAGSGGRGGASGARIITSLLENDAKIADMVSQLYNSVTGLKNPPALPLSKGSFTGTAYFHAGRFSFSTPGWWAPEEEQRPGGRNNTDSSAAGRSAGNAQSGTMANYEARFLKWADKENLKDVFVPWKPVTHQSFGDKKVEAGGIAPYALFNPPAAYLDSIAVKHLRFVDELLGAMPEIQIVNVKTEKLPNNVNRVTIQLVNKGRMPAYAQLGDRVRFVNKLKTEVQLASGQSILSGRKIHLGNSLQPGESVTHSWLISGKGKIIITAGCATTGTKSIELSL